jgi:(2Fe-2S) ferredoxin
MTKIERHFFVCANQRPQGGKPSCGAHGAAAILTALQDGLGAHPELWGRVAITATGCLGPCFEGPMMVVYPEAVWYAGVRVEDVAEIVETHMVAGRPVERLVYRSED